MASDPTLRTRPATAAPRTTARPEAEVRPPATSTSTQGAHPFTRLGQSVRLTMKLLRYQAELQRTRRQLQEQLKAWREEREGVTSLLRLGAAAMKPLQAIAEGKLSRLGEMKRTALNPEHFRKAPAREQLARVSK